MGEIEGGKEGESGGKTERLLATVQTTVMMGKLKIKIDSSMKGMGGIKSRAKGW